MLFDSVRFPKARPLGLLALLSLGLFPLLVGCNLNRAPIVWTTDLDPSFVCPGDSV